ncbi:hypothetical protein EVAR_823_1 [Eumeta japonica]|uniref:Uncharacterized protein n=1 Tax=Eumeta variegata TaxID=151549 RepID=A0A4C1SGF9_EUMVA|nr:hypothetical protein EVAR_823_1 [Eumeta japonica]
MNQFAQNNDEEAMKEKGHQKMCSTGFTHVTSRSTTSKGAWAGGEGPILRGVRQNGRLDNRVPGYTNKKLCPVKHKSDSRCGTVVI